MTKKLSELLSNKFGPEIREGSMISNEIYISDLVKTINPSVVLEIGTLFGCSAALFAQYAEKVITIDITSSPAINRQKAESVWRYLGYEGKIQSHYVTTDAEKRSLVESLNYDMALIDGGHEYEQVKYDFSCVQKCGIVLFHDYKPSNEEYYDCNNMRYDDVVKFVDELHPRPFIWGPHCGKFALWIDSEHHLLKSVAFSHWKKSIAQKE
jgi:predicted O-methyltransferase YrrM